MSIRRNAAAAAIGIAAILTAFGAAAQTTFDLSPEQASRVHTTRIDAAAAAIPAGFKFVKAGVFTVGVSVGDCRR
jgi:polar amino acid transport system substrate-binding protein